MGSSYLLLSGQVKGDGDPTCFSNVKDTGIPELQQWCHELTVSSRERAARNFLSHLKTFAASVRTYVEGVGDVTVTDREALRAKWESSEHDGADDQGQMGWDEGTPDSDEDPFEAILGGLGGGLGNAGLYRMNKPAPKVDAYGNRVGVTPRLVAVRALLHLFVY